MNLFSLSDYYEPYFYNGEWEYDPDHMVFGSRDKKSAMKVFIDCYFSRSNFSFVSFFSLSMYFWGSSINNSAKSPGI